MKRWLLTMVFAGAACGGEEPIYLDCTLGSVSCDGAWTMVCDARRLVFVRDVQCPVSTHCEAGACVEGEPLPDPTSARDTSQPEDVVEDAGVETIETVATETRVESETRADVADDASSETDIRAETDTRDANDATDVLADVVPDTIEVEVVGPADGFTPIATTRSLRKVRWHPSGDYALLIAGANELVRYTPDGALVGLGTLGTTLRDLDVGADGTFVIVGEALGFSTVWQVDADAELVVVAEDTLSLGYARVVVAEPGTSRFAVGAFLSIYVGYLYVLEDGALGSPTAFGTTAGLVDLMWSSSSSLITAEGDFGSSSHTWPVGGFVATTTGWPATFGAPRAAAWRPAHSVGTMVGADALFTYDGVWTSTSLAADGTAEAIGWSDDGTRAFIVGDEVLVRLDDGLQTPLDPRGALQDVDWRPDHCEALLVGDAVAVRYRCE